MSTFADTHRGAEPWNGYDEQGEASIAYALTEVSPTTARAVLAYERAHLDRRAVIAAAAARAMG
jgi:hypothetical protein